MGRRRSTKAKRSLGAMPRGLVNRNGSTSSATENPFEVTARMKRPKHEVHNRTLSKPKSTKYALESLQRRQTQLRATLKSGKKANVLVDRRIGQYDASMSEESQMLARLVKERTRQSQRASKYRLDESDHDVLTHKGKRLDPEKTEDLYSDDEDNNGNLEAVDTELHFGGAKFGQRADPYGASSGADLSQVYSQRKTELDDLIARRKTLKAERMQLKEDQLQSVEKLDEGFADLSQLLLFRKDQPRALVKYTNEDNAMTDWHTEMKKMMTKPKGRATDRTKTPEEVAKEESERLHELETRRLARMNGDFEEDDLSDISVDGNELPIKKRNKRKTQQDNRNPEELSDSEDDGDEIEARFTPDGLVFTDKDGKIVSSDTRSEEDGKSDTKEDLDDHPLPRGTKVQGNYRAAEQFDGREAWYDGEITKVHILADGNIRYDVEYLDGDFEEDMLPVNVRATEKTEEKKEVDEEAAQSRRVQLKRAKARDRARKNMPFVFAVPTTLEAFHDLVSRYASTGEDVGNIIDRIYRTNSVRLDHRNIEKMQNFYDVLLRRFIAVGDAIFTSGNGGKELSRHKQLSSMTKVLFLMAQDSPETAGAVWNRRIGILQNAHSKRLRDFEMVSIDEINEFTPWLSTGTFLLLKALTSIFPVTDRRHHVVTPTNLLLGQIVAQTPITSESDLVLGVLCSGLLLENCIEANRVVPEALGFLSGVCRLFSGSRSYFALPTLAAAYDTPCVYRLRQGLYAGEAIIGDIPPLQLERNFLGKDKRMLALSILAACIHIIQSFMNSLVANSVTSVEILAEISDSLLVLSPRILPQDLRQKVSDIAAQLAVLCSKHKCPLRRHAGVQNSFESIKSLAPRMEDPERYKLSKDKSKKSLQAALDRTRREYKREHKAISRELRLDASFIENERRAEQSSKDHQARTKRQKNFSWLEGEQAAMNQQVAQGGGLLKGGGMGAAKAKAASAKLGIKRGGKF